MSTHQALHAKVGNLCKEILINLFCPQRNLNLEFILFITRMAKDSPERVSSWMQTKYVTLEYCFILMSLYLMFSSFEFLILCLLPNKLNLVLSSPK